MLFGSLFVFVEAKKQSYENVIINFFIPRKSSVSPVYLNGRSVVSETILVGTDPIK